MRASKSGPPRRDAAPPDQNPARRPRRRRLLIAAAVLVVVAALAVAGVVLTMNGTLAARIAAASVGEHRISGVQFSYFYRDAYARYLREDPIASQSIQPDVPFDRQVYNEELGTTWADYFIGEAAQTAAETYRLYDAATAAGFTLSAEARQSLEDTRAQLESLPSLLPDVESVDDYLRDNFGRGCDLESYLEYLRIGRVAADYAAQYREGLTYSEDALRAAYAAAPEDYDTVSYKIFYSSVVTGRNDDNTVQVDMAQSEANAKAMAEAARGDVDKFNELTVELSADRRKAVYSDPTFSLRQNVTVSDANDVLRPWLTDPARQYGDTTYVRADDQGYYVGFFLGSSDNAFELASLQVIPVRAYADASSADDPDGFGAAETRAREIFDALEAGPRTAAAFSDLAGQYTTYDPVYSPYLPGALDRAVDAWCYDETRQPGDYAMLRGAAGYYVVWFDGYSGVSYRDQLVDDALRAADYDAWYRDVTGGDPAALHSLGLYFMSK